MRELSRFPERELGNHRSPAVGRGGGSPAVGAGLAIRPGGHRAAAGPTGIKNNPDSALGTEDHRTRRRVRVCTVPFALKRTR